MTITINSQIESAVLTAAKQAAVVVDRSNLGMLKINGATRLDLLDRMSTQMVKNLTTGQGAATVLTTNIGRMIDRLILYASSDTVYALTSENNAETIARYLMSYVFFNDDFQLLDISGETAVYAIYGPQAAHILAGELGFPDAEMPHHHWRKAEVDGVTAYLHRTDPINGYGYFVMCETAVADTLYQQLLSSGLVAANEAAYDYLRIQAGYPRLSYDLTGEYIPLEANLWADVSFNKGCYIGQEIIARMESRGRLAKKLVKLSLSAPAKIGTPITAEGKKAGTLTSVAIGPDDVMGLGYVKTSVLEADQTLQVNDMPIIKHSVIQQFNQ